MIQNEGLVDKVIIICEGVWYYTQEKGVLEYSSKKG